MTDIRELQDRLEIRELAERYTMGITCRDWDAVASCYHEDAQWRAPQVGMDLRGREGIAAGLRASVEPNALQLQMQHALVIDTLTADRATARSILHEVVQHPGAQSGVNVLGVYNDVITKLDGVWKFTRRIFYIHYRDDAPLPGAVTVDYDNQPSADS